MNRLISVNLDSVSLESLPPAVSEGRTRLLFVSSVILGFRRYHENIIRYCAADETVDAVHIQLRFPFWNKLLGKSLPVLGAKGYDLHSYRHLIMWRYILRHWFGGPLPLDRFDAVHILTEGVGLAVIDFAKQTPTKFAINIDVTAVQDYEELGFSRLARRPVVAAQQRMFDAADLVVCRNQWCSHSLRRDFGLTDEKIHVARNSMTPSAISRQDHPPRREGEPVRIVFVGNDFERKGGPQLVKLHQERFCDRAELHICSGRARPDNSLRNVVWHGAVPNDRLRGELLPTMDIFVLPTRNDMHPWAVLEAAATGLPVVSSRLAGIPEMVLDGHTGWLCPVGDWTAVGDATERLVADAPLREQMGRNARAHIEANYNPDLQFGGLIERLKALGA